MGQSGPGGAQSKRSSHTSERCRSSPSTCSSCGPVFAVWMTCTTCGSRTRETRERPLPGRSSVDRRAPQWTTRTSQCALSDRRAARGSRHRSDRRSQRVLGFVQEAGAERAVLALRNAIHPLASVIREGRERRVPVEEVVPGAVDLRRAAARPVRHHDVGRCRSRDRGRPGRLPGCADGGRKARSPLSSQTLRVCSRGRVAPALRPQGAYAIFRNGIQRSR
jgi:hypothetical protein